MKKLLSLALVLLSACGCVTPEPEKVQAIQYVPQAQEPETTR